ncbi:MAG: MaoC family dehydratase [Bacteroidota bacterium]
MNPQQQTDKPYASSFKRLSDMKDHVGKELGLTEWVTITQERINIFADATEDHQWIHVDPKMSAQNSPYKATVAHGFLVLSLASKFTYETYTVDDVVMGVNYGLDRVRFPNATVVGALLRGRVSLMSYAEKDGGARIKLSVVFELKGEEKPACVAEFIGQAYTKQ